MPTPQGLSAFHPNTDADPDIILPSVRAGIHQSWFQTDFLVTCKPFCGKTTSSEKPQNILGGSTPNQQKIVPLSPGSLLLPSHSVWCHPQKRLQGEGPPPGYGRNPHPRKGRCGDRPYQCHLPALETSEGSLAPSQLLTCWVTLIWASYQCPVPLIW